MNARFLASHRAAKDKFFSESHQSPLDPAVRESFRGLNYFPPSEKLVFRVVPEHADGSEVVIETSDGRHKKYRKEAYVTIKVKRQSFTLTLYGTDNPGYFLPFRDATSGKSTYGGGRYLDVDRPHAGAPVTVDFNLAYNPFCVYGDGFSCPIPPQENWMTIPIKAGEKNWIAG